MELLLLVGMLMAGVLVVGLVVAITTTIVFVFLRLCWWMIKLGAVVALVVAAVLIGVLSPVGLLAAAALLGYWLGRKSKRAVAASRV